MNMIELCYVSSANDRYSDQVLVELLSKARTNNRQADVTGLLLYDGIGTFIQALEGEEKVVKSLFDRVKSDQMHKRVNILGVKNINERSFSDWQMGFRFINNQFLTKDEILKIEGFSEFLDSSQTRRHQVNNGFALEMLYYFRDAGKGQPEAIHKI